MDMDIDGVSLNTPTKKIKELSLSSPHGYSSPTSSIATCMVNKGYSHRITNNVLSELNSRANEISMIISSPPPTNESDVTRTNKSNRNKRFSIIHRTRFNQMESIDQHYSVHETSSSKRRRTLNEKEEIVAIQIPHGNENEDQRKESIRKISPIKKSPVEISPARVSPARVSAARVFPVRVSPAKISPSKISPSKRSINLHAQLHEKTIQVTDTGSPNKRNIIEPSESTRLRVSSLELSGVKPLQRKSSIPQLQQNSDTTLTKKPSIPKLQRKSSMPQLQKKPSIPQLQKKPSIPQLQKKPSIPQLQKKPSIPQLQKKSSIPQLQKKPSIPSFNRNPPIPQLYHTSHAQATVTTTTVTSTTTTNLMPPPPPPSHTIQRKSSIPQLQKIPNSSRISPSKSFNQKNSPILHNSTNMPKSKSITIPQPFSLYDKPTVSSSQKSLNKFQRFKEKFS